MVIEPTAYAPVELGPSPKLVGLVGNCLACNVAAFHPSDARRLPLPARHHSCQMQSEAAPLREVRERVQRAA